ncbi:substrate-binding periplasmic protein [Inhella proteolytica]|uniref:Transporter substrate-binding domain-containing protein n=1 Tax=Inhella proteolytica TaxID=2795029 RepID=A0A931NJF8_9BURK|nr:transporter substrate-binding domain-containing protein [Inhella proteolytica]MBH9578974.1 transporter substrate-binding domain-containing protein [Inhella proteolytica]
MRRRDCLSLCAASLQSATAAGAGAGAARPRVRFPRPQRQFELRRWYPLALLEQALQRSGWEVELQPSEQVMVQSRALRELQEPDGAVDVAWSVTSAAREQALRPIRIPIYRGLFGWRVLLVPQSRRDALRAVQDLEGLRALTLLQGHDWPDTEILRANGLRVLTTARYDQLFAMLARGRADAFPRGVTEVEYELARESQTVALEPHLLLHYPAAEYFFVSTQRPDLAEALEQGLLRMVEQGDLDRLLQRHHGAALKALHLGERRRIALHNPLLPSATPLADERLWWRP